MVDRPLKIHALNRKEKYARVEISSSAAEDVYEDETRESIGALGYNRSNIMTR
jgi:hypothetical protein